VPTQRAHRAPASSAPRRSLVRSAIALLLQKPALALDITPPYRFVALRQPGVALLAELIAIVSARPDIGTGALLAQFEGREEVTALQKLASQTLPGDDAGWHLEFLDVIAQLDRQTLLQRTDELQAKQREEGLDAVDKAELRELLLARGRGGA
jgi:DNA primase